MVPAYVSDKYQEPFIPWTSSHDKGGIPLSVNVQEVVTGGALIKHCKMGPALSYLYTEDVKKL